MAAAKKASSGKSRSPPYRSCEGSISTATPMKPTITPASRLASNLSSARKKCPITTEQSGVVALRIAPSVLGKLCCAQKLSDQGTTLFRRAITKKTPHNAQLRGSEVRVSNTTGVSASAAITTRAKTSVRGGTPPSATLMQGKEQPHNTDRVTNIPQVRRVITISTAGRAPDIPFLSNGTGPAKLTCPPNAHRDPRRSVKL